MRNRTLGILLIIVGISLVVFLMCTSTMGKELYTVASSLAPYKTDLLPKFDEIQERIRVAQKATCVSNYNRMLLIQDANRLVTKAMEIYDKPEIKEEVIRLKSNMNDLLLKLEDMQPCGSLCNKECVCNAVDVNGQRYCQPSPPSVPMLNWKLVDTTPKPSKRSSSMRWIDTTGNLWVYGGISEDGKPLYDMWLWDGDKWIEMVLQKDGHPPVFTGGMCWVTNDNKLWMFGGTSDSSPYTNQMWMWNGAWNLREQCCSEIKPRTNGAVWLDLEGNVWLFGGEIGYNRYTNDLWKWDGNWTLVNPASHQLYYKIHTRGNQPRARHGAMTWTDNKNTLWLFGGRCEVGDLNDLWRYDGISWTWYNGTEGISKAERVSTEPRYDNTPRAIAYGMCWENKAKTILWLYDGVSLWNWDTINNTWVWRGEQDLGFRTKCVSAISMPKHSVYIFGGILANQTTTDEFWVLK